MTETGQVLVMMQVTAIEAGKSKIDSNDRVAQIVGGTPKTNSKG